MEMDCARGATVAISCQYLLDENVKSVSGWVINAPDALVVGDGGEHVMRCLIIFVHVVHTHGPLSRTGSSQQISATRSVVAAAHR
jgi:hypothetical protein